MGEHTEKQFIYLKQKYPPGEEWGHPEWGAQWRGDLNHLCRTVLPGFCFVCIWPIILFLFAYLTGLRTLPKMRVQLFSKMDPTAEAYGCMSIHIMGWHSLPFWPPRSLSAHVQTGEYSLTSGVGTLFLYFSRAQLLPLALSLECLGENKASVLLHLTNSSCLAQGPIYLVPRCH